MGTVTSVTIGSDSFDVYSLTADPIVDITTFWNARLGATATAVAAASTDDKKRALVMASDWIDRALTFSGTKTVDSQSRDWPRDDATCDGTAITDGTTPDNIANATFWLAGQLLVDASAADSAGLGSNLKRAKAGSAEVEFFSPTIGSASDTRLPIVAMDYLKCYLGGTGSVGLPGGSGDTNSSAFCENDFERGEGFA